MEVRRWKIEVRRCCFLQTSNSYLPSSTSSSKETRRWSALIDFRFSAFCIAFVCFLLSAFCSVTKEELYSHPGWQWCTFEGAELHTLLLGLRATFREKLE